MVRAALVVVVLSAGCGRCGSGGNGGSDRPPAAGDARPGSQAAPADARPGPGSVDARPTSDAAPAGRPLPFVTGQVVVAAPVDGLVRPLRLDATRGTWDVLGSGDAHLFPTEAADGAAVLAIASRGEHEDDHVERLAWVRGAAVEEVGPPARSLRNPGHARGVLVFESSERSLRDLYRLDRGGRVARLTDDAAGNFEPALSPDGAHVVFVSSRDGDAELYRLPTRGGRATRLTASARDDWGARWSPDGRRLVFLSDREGPPRAFVMDADGTHIRRLTDETDPDVAEDAPRWSPDGRTIALVRARGAAGGVVLVPAERRGPARPLTPDDAVDRDPAWSPDGAHLIVTRRQPGTARARVTFVRIADSHPVTLDGAADPVDPLALRWYPSPPPPPPANPAAGSPGAAAPD